MLELKIYFTSVKGRRESNEDRHNIILNINGDDLNKNPINFFGIYDGHGGTWVSKYLERNMPNYYMDKKFTPPFSPEYHEQVFRLVQSQLLKNSLGYSNGSTCLLNLMYKHKESIHLNIVNLGDSRLSIVYSNGVSKSITKDHKPDDSVEKSRLEKMGGEVYKDSESVYRIGDLSLSRAFGDGDNAPYISQKPDVFYKKITLETKYIIMACDGLWDVIESEEIGQVLNDIIKKKNPDNLAVELAKLAIEKGSTDNVSVIVIEVIH
jgi:serine/threonine protein phosphatase PrpC